MKRLINELPNIGEVNAEKVSNIEKNYYFEPLGGTFSVNQLVIGKYNDKQHLFRITKKIGNKYILSSYSESTATKSLMKIFAQNLTIDSLS